MGTNFYWLTDLQSCEIKLPTGETITFAPDDMDPKIHVGKRSAAGAYCWVCHTTLCKQGEEGIHYDASEWHEHCPKCGSGVMGEESNIGNNAAGVEMGFTKPKDMLRVGVTSCCSFSWAQDPDVVLRICKENPDNKIIRDEYDRPYTGKEFLMELELCPVRYTRSINTEFA